jgi:glycosyltransferase involved in cell wall biosynthesis
MLTVLITNIWLTTLGGSETYVRELALELKRRGHRPMIYSPSIDAGTKILFPKIPVVDDLHDLPFKPDIIHGHHKEPVAKAAAFFPGVPVIYVSHSAADFLSLYEMPEVSSGISRYVAVDQLVKRALLTKAKTPPEKTIVIYNFVDTNRFLPRKPLPRKPEKALVFSNYTFQDTVKKERLEIIRAACERAGMSLDVMGRGTSLYTPHPEFELGKYDIVFAKAKSALEALAVGNAVILCDCLFGVGEMVTEENFGHCRSYNFGNFLLSKPFDVNVLLEEIQKYDPARMVKTRERTRSECNLQQGVDELIRLYITVLDESQPLIRRICRRLWCDNFFRKLWSRE